MLPEGPYMTWHYRISIKSYNVECCKSFLKVFYLLIIESENFTFLESYYIIYE